MTSRKALDYFWATSSYNDTSANAYETIDRDLKVLEIIRNKSVDISYIRLCMNVKDGLRKMYNYSITNSNDELTEEEYETLVGWLKNE